MRAPRVQVSLSPQAYEAIRAISEASGTSMSAVIGEVIEEAAPVLQKLAVSIVEAAKLQDAQKAQLLRALEREASKLKGHAAAAYKSVEVIAKAASRTPAGRAARGRGRVGLQRRSRSPV